MQLWASALADSAWTLRLYCVGYNDGPQTVLMARMPIIVLAFGVLRRPGIGEGIGIGIGNRRKLGGSIITTNEQPNYQNLCLSILSGFNLDLPAV